MDRLLTAVNVAIAVDIREARGTVTHCLVSNNIVDSLTDLVYNYYWLWKSRFSPESNEKPPGKLYVEEEAADAAFKCLQV